MSYAGIDCSFPSHPKIVVLTDAEYRIHSTAIIYANEHRTDGVISREAVTVFRGYKATAVKQLETRGLWLPHDDGWVIRNYLKWNKSRAEIEELQAKKSRAGRAGAATTHGGGR